MSMRSRPGSEANGGPNRAGSGGNRKHPILVEGDPRTVEAVLDAFSTHEFGEEREWWGATLGATRRYLESRPDDVGKPFVLKQLDEIGQALSDLERVGGKKDLAAWKARYKLLFSNLVVAGSSVWTDWGTTWGRARAENRD